MASVDDDQEFNALLEQSSLGSPGSHELRARTEAARSADVRRIVELRDVIAHSTGATARNAARELAVLMCSIGDGHSGAAQLTHLAEDTSLSSSERVQAAEVLAGVKGYEHHGAELLVRLAEDAAMADFDHVQAAEALARALGYRQYRVDLPPRLERAIDESLGPVADIEDTLATIKDRVRSRQLSEPVAEQSPTASTSGNPSSRVRREASAPALVRAGQPIPEYARAGSRTVDYVSPHRVPSTPAAGPGDPPQHDAGRSASAQDVGPAMFRAFRYATGGSWNLEVIARSLSEVLVARVADFACVDLLDGLLSDGELPADPPDNRTVLRRVARTFNTGSPRWNHVLDEGSLLTMPRSTPPGLALQENQPVLVPLISADVAVDYAASLGGPEPIVVGCSMLVLPLSARGTVLGVLTLLRLPDRDPFDRQAPEALLELTAWASLQLDNARLHRAESKAAAILQRSMIPTRPPKIPGVQIAHRYKPGDRKAEVGGDWVDAIQLPGSRVALVVGDVMGHGLHSAAAMGRFRTAMQTLAALDLPPAQLLRHLDNLAQKLGDDHLATCLYAVYDPINRTCELASAGHVPPVLVHPDGRGEPLDLPPGAPIGVGGVPFVATKIDVSDGSMLVLCTDGLLDVRGGDVRDGLAALCGNLIDPKQTPDEACDTVLYTLASDYQQDDVALLVARFDGMPPGHAVAWDLRADITEVSRARRLVRGQLAAWQLETLTDDTELLVSELVTNAVRAAGAEVQLQLIRGSKLLVEVSDDNHDLPSLEPVGHLDEAGRGLSLVSRIAERWGASRKGAGKVVWFELAVPDIGHEDTG